MTQPAKPRIAHGLAVAALVLSGLLASPTSPASAQGCGGALGTSTGNLIGSALGGAAGGLLGNQFGRGSGKGVMTGVGVLGGALAGGYVGRSIEGCGNAAPRRAAAPTPYGAPARHGTVPRHAVAATAPATSRPRTCRFVATKAAIEGREQQIDAITCLDEADGSWKIASGSAAEQAAQTDLVLRAQQRLHEQGFYVRDNIDGRWGPGTGAAVSNFQRANGFAASGRLDVATRRALGLDSAPAPSPAASGPAAQENPIPAASPPNPAGDAARSGSILPPAAAGNSPSPPGK